MPWLILLSIGAGIAALAHIAPFPFLLDWTSGGVAMWRMPQYGRPTVYLTFDDGPNPAATPMLLDVLRRENVQATFFLIDRHLTAATAPIVRRTFEDGHAVGLHSHTRRLMLLPPGTFTRTLADAATRIEVLTGYSPCRAFRPHAGWRSVTMMRGLEQRRMRLFGWGWMLWDFDWFRKRSADRLVPRLARRAGPGSIIVLHDGHHVDPAADRSYTIETVQRLIPLLRAKGLSFGTVCAPARPARLGS